MLVFICLFFLDIFVYLSICMDIIEIDILSLFDNTHYFIPVILP